MGALEHAVGNIVTDLARMTGETAALRASIERQGDRLSAAIDAQRISTQAAIDALRSSMQAAMDGQRNSSEASIDSLRSFIESGLREQRLWNWSAFRWQLGITIGIGAALFGMIAHGLRWF